MKHLLTKLALMLLITAVSLTAQTAPGWPQVPSAPAAPAPSHLARNIAIGTAVATVSAVVIYKIVKRGHKQEARRTNGK